MLHNKQLSDVSSIPLVTEMAGSGLSPVNYVNCTIEDRSIMHLLGISKTQIEVDGYLTSQF